jgi:hypothetical protein
MTPTHYSPGVLVERRGIGIDALLVVQRFNPATNQWVDLKTFHEASDSCTADVRAYLSTLENPL